MNPSEFVPAIDEGDQTYKGKYIVKNLYVLRANPCFFNCFICFIFVCISQRYFWSYFKCHQYYFHFLNLLWKSSVSEYIKLEMKNSYFFKSLKLTSNDLVVCLLLERMGSWPYTNWAFKSLLLYVASTKTWTLNLPALWYGLWHSTMERRNALNTFYLQLHCVGHVVKNHSDSERGNPLLPLHWLFFMISSKVSFMWTSHIKHSTYHGLCYTKFKTNKVKKEHYLKRQRQYNIPISIKLSFSSIGQDKSKLQI